MDREKFLDAARGRIGPIAADAKEGFDLILEEAATRKTPVNDLAYILATTWWETARTMAPVREAFYVARDFDRAESWRKKNLWYYPYYGRGYVQLTHRANYAYAGKKLGIDFVGEPDRVMEPRNAVRILFDGMNEGWFTKKKLDDYIDDEDEGDNEDLDEYIRARRIINGTNKAAQIGALALIFEAALKEAGYAGARPGEVAAGAGAPAPSAPSSVSMGFEAHIGALGLKHFKPYEFLVKGASNGNPHSAAFDLNTEPPGATWKNINDTALALDELRGGWAGRSPC